MYTINDFKKALHDNGENTLLGMHLNGLFHEKERDGKASIHNLEEKVEVIAQMNKNGINVFTDSFKLGSITKAYYQWRLTQYTDFQ